MPKAMLVDALQSLLQFSAAYALILVIPGTVMITTGSIAALHGFRTATTFIVGVAAGAGIITASVGLAINTLASAVPSFVAHIGSATLLLLVAGTILSSSQRTVQQARQSATAGSMIALIFAGLASTLTSPLTAVFATAMFSRPLSNAHAPLGVAVATLVVILANLCWYGALAAAFSRPIAQAFLLRHRRSFQAGSAALLACLAFHMLAQASTELFTRGL